MLEEAKKEREKVHKLGMYQKWSLALPLETKQGLPTHKQVSQMSKGCQRDALSEHLKQCDMAVLGMLPKPMVLDCIVLEARDHLVRLEPSQREGINIVLMHPNVQIGDTLNRQADDIANSPDRICNLKQVLAGSAKSNILSLHGGHYNLSLKMGFPKNGTTKGTYDEATTTAGAMRILRILMTI
jgi:hypothetical protein